ncbi:uncharacterized protein [Paramisgurnus dabryanus]|uniref:uncharacterized protein n=1 Tax=Paramisgurnus dabryanus TaxID=90735 RepID=UPI0031F439B8
MPTTQMLNPRSSGLTKQELEVKTVLLSRILEQEWIITRCTECSEEELLAELEAINTHDSSGTTGTRIIIWNLRKTSTDASEFDFEADQYDIQIPDDVYEDEKEKYKQSLRAYCSVLYLKPRMQIIIRGQKVKTQLIAKSLAFAMKDKYTPNFLNKKKIPITFGYNPKNKEHYGVMMYHKNRLIKAYERVGCQNRANKKGVGVIAVIECNFLKPTHNKQDFDYTEEYRTTMNALGKKLEEYWKAICHEKGLNGIAPSEDIPECPDQNWVQCDDCLKWRKLPDGIDTDKLPDKWFCHMNPDTQFRRCDEPEEPDDSKDETSTPLNSYKQHKRKQQELKKMQMEEKKRNADLEDLRKKEEEIFCELRKTGSSPPRSPTPSLKAAMTARSPEDSSDLPQSASNPSDSMQVTSHPPLTRRKRRLEELEGNSQDQKKLRALNDDFNNAPDSPSTSTLISNVVTSQIEIPDDNDSADKEEIESNTDDDDIVIDETKSTPRPKASTFNLAMVKLESSTSNDVQDNGDISMETLAGEDARDATIDSSTSNGQVSITDQAEYSMTIKMEEDQQRKREEVAIKVEKIKSYATRMEQDSTEVECKKEKGNELIMSITKDSMKIESKPSLAERSYRSTDGTSHMPKEAAMDSGLNIYNMATLEAQKHQYSLLEVMEATAKEREEYNKMQAQSLPGELKNKECELLKLSVKKEFSHQNIQADPLEEQDYKTLYLEATQRNEQLTKKINVLEKKQEEMLLQMKAEKEAQERMKAEGAMTNVDNKMALQVDLLLRELNQRNKECDELKRKLHSLEQEKLKCEQLWKDLDDTEGSGTDRASSTQAAQHCNTEDTSANCVSQIKETRKQLKDQ